MYLEAMMKNMLFVHTQDSPEMGLRDQIAMLKGVELVYEFSGHTSTGGEYPDFVVVTNYNHNTTPDTLQVAIEALSPGVRIYTRTIWAEQPHIIGVDDIPGPLPIPAPRMRVAQPIIDRVPGIEPSHTAVVHQDFSTQAGLASFAGIGGLQHLATLAD